MIMQGILVFGLSKLTWTPTARDELFHARIETAFARTFRNRFCNIALPESSDQPDKFREETNPSLEYADIFVRINPIRQCG